MMTKNFFYKNKKQMRVFLHCALLGVATITLLHGAFAYAQEEEAMPLSLQSAVMFALQESPKIGISEEQTVQAGEAINEAKSVYYPKVDVSTEIGKEYSDPGIYGPLATTDDPNLTTAANARLSLRQIIFDGAVFTEVDRREQALQSAHASSLITQQQIASDTIKNYLDIYKYQNDYANAQNLIKSLEFYVNRLKQAVDAGAESEAKFKFAQARLDLAKNRINTANSALNESTHKLQLLTGPLPAFLTVKPEELNLTSYELDFFHELAVSDNPELLLAESDIKTGKLDVKRQHKEFLPKLNLVADASQEQHFGELREREARAMIQLKYDIFDGFARESTEARLKSRVRELEYEKEDTLREVKSELSTLYSEILADQEKAKLKQKEIVSYISLQKINLEALDQGDMDIFEVIENEERLNTAQSELNQLTVNTFIRSYQILRFIGAMKKQRFCESC